MSDVNGNSSIDEVQAWLTKQLDEIKKLAEQAKENPSDELLTQAKTILNNAKTLVKEKDKVMSSENDPNRTGANNKFNTIITEMEKEVSTISSKNDTNINASMALSELMNDTTFQEIQEIEKQILYRKFYFPGGTPKLRVVGQGTNSKTDDFEYDQSLEGSDPFDHWDPRYLKEYITIAKQNGFHRNFIYYNGSDFNTINYSQAMEVLKKCVNWSTGKIDVEGGCDKYEVAGIIGGLMYFDKASSFVEETGIAGGSSSMFNRAYIINGDLVQPTIEKLANGLIQQSEKKFKEDNFGWMANNNKYAFDSAQYLTRWMELESKYNEYKEKVWKILEGTNALQLCTNNVNVTGNNITIQQEMSCMQTIADAENKTDESTTTSADDKGSVDSETDRTSSSTSTGGNSGGNSSGTSGGGSSGNSSGNSGSGGSSSGTSGGSSSGNGSSGTTGSGGSSSGTNGSGGNSESTPGGNLGGSTGSENTNGNDTETTDPSDDSITGNDHSINKIIIGVSIVFGLICVILIVCGAVYRRKKLKKSSGGSINCVNVSIHS